jgi:acyl-CoA thioester hydrolase
MITSAIEIRVIFGDTDQMGIVYYANYLRFFEAGRGAYLRERGRSYREIEAQGYQMPVMEAHVKYLRPSRYEDVLIVTTWIDAVRGASMRFSYEIARGDEPVAQGWTEHACLGKNGRPTRIPGDLRDLLREATGV